ncbi:MAG: acyltransferase [Pseudomonadales bacterium]|nr:acyltransferase [Pseudomonadales bacterium]
MRYWSDYKETLDPKADFKSIFIRSSKRYASLDGARGLTILLMVLFHVLFGVVRLLHKNSSEDEFIRNFPEWLNWLWHAQGSDPLFVMCGLLVSFSMFKEFDKNQTLQVATFYKRRLARILPLFLLALLIYMPTGSHNLDYLVSNLFFASNYFDSQRTIIPVGWSLDLQMLFYFLLPLFYIYLFYKTRFKITLLVGLILATTVWRMWILYMEPSLYERPFFDAISDKEHAKLLSQTLYYDFDMRIASFLMGMLMAALHHYHGNVIRKVFERYPLVNISVLVTGLAMIYFSVSVPFHNRHAEFYQDFSPFWNFIFLSLARYGYSMGIAILVFMVLNPYGPSKFFERIFRTRLLYPFAQLIFPIYLFHFPFIVVAAVCVLGTTDRHAITDIAVWQIFAVYALTVLFTAAFATVLHVYIEKPIIRMVDKRYK